MFTWELDFLKLLEGLRTDFLNFVFELVTMLGEDTVVVILMAIIYFAFDKRLARKIFFVTAVSLGINGVIKNIVRLPRPFADGSVTCVRPDTATGYSFPSGHTQSFAAWSTALSSTYKKNWLRAAAAVLILLTAFSRMYLGAHYPSDVAAGALLGVLCSLVFGSLYEKATNKNKLFSASVLAFAPFMIYFILMPDAHFADFFKFCGMLAGLAASTVFEEKYVNFGYDCSVFKKALRVIASVTAAYFIKEGFELLNFQSLRIELIFCSIGYFTLTFTVLALLPLLFKKLTM